jgi:hypothetical protein
MCWRWGFRPEKPAGQNILTRPLILNYNVTIKGMGMTLDRLARLCMVKGRLARRQAGDSWLGLEDYFSHSIPGRLFYPEMKRKDASNG